MKVNGIRIIVSITVFVFWGCLWDSESNLPDVEKGSFTDGRDGQEYETVEIGTQLWMAENLNINIDSSLCFKHSEDLCGIHGRIYTWNIAVGNDITDAEKGLKIQGICPDGWYIPRTEEWDVLVEHIGGKTNGTVLKSRDGWLENGNGTDMYGFSAKPGGTHISSTGIHAWLGTTVSWWSSSLSTSMTIDGIYIRHLSSESKYLNKFTSSRTSYKYLRCISE